MGRQLYQYHPVVGYHFIPGLKTRIEHESGGYLVRVNGAGFRCRHEFSPERTPGKKRILIFGDSYTAGDGVSNKKRYTDLLEELMPGLEVYNFGLSGSGTDQHYLAFRELAAGIEYDALVIAVQLENIRRVAARYRYYITPDGVRKVIGKPFFTLEGGALKLNNIPAPKDELDPDDLPKDELEHVYSGGNFALLRALANKMPRAVKDAALKFSKYQPVPAYDDPNNTDWLVMRAILAQWVNEAAAPVVIFLVPMYHFVEEKASPAGYQARFAELHDPPRVTVHDALPDFHAVPLQQRSTFRFAKDIHPTPEAHRVLAGSLKKAVAPLLGEDA